MTVTASRHQSPVSISLQAVFSDGLDCCVAVPLASWTMFRPKIRSYTSYWAATERWTAVSYAISNHILIGRKMIVGSEAT